MGLRIGRRRWMIGLVTIGTVLNYLARSSLSIAAPTLKQAMAISTQQHSWVVAAYRSGYTVMQPVAGYTSIWSDWGSAVPGSRSAGLSPDAVGCADDAGRHLFDPRVVATAGRMAGSAAWIGGMRFSLIICALADTIGYNPLFACLAIFDLIGAAV